MGVIISSFPHPLYHLLDLLLVNRNQLPIGMDNGVFGLDVSDDFAFDFHDLALFDRFAVLSPPTIDIKG